MVMTAQGGTGVPAIGLPWKLVRVEDINTDNGLAAVIDQFGARMTLRFDYRRGKGPIPVVGEQWIIDRTLGNWTFSTVVKEKRPVVTGATDGNPAIISLLGTLSTAGLIIDQTDHTGGSGTGTHDHMGTGADSTVLYGLLDTDAATAAGASALSGGDGAAAFGDGSIVFGHNSSDLSTDSYHNVILGQHERVYGLRNIALVIEDGLLGDLATPAYSQGNIVMQTNRYGFADWQGYSGNGIWHEIDNCTAIGNHPIIGLPYCDEATTVSESSIFVTGKQILNISASDDNTWTWGENILSVNASPAGEGNDVIGQDLISIGNNWVARERGPFDGTQVYEWLYQAQAYGYNCFVSGDQSIVMGNYAETSRAGQMLFWADGQALTLGGIIEYTTDFNASVQQSGTLHSGGLRGGSIIPFRTNAGNITFILDDITSGAGFSYYDSGTYPNGNDYNNGKAQGTWLIIKKVSSDSNHVIVQPNSGTLDGLASITLTDQWDYVEVLALRYRTGDVGPGYAWANAWTILDGRIGGVPIGASGGGGATGEIPLVHGAPSYTPTPSAGNTVAAYDEDNDVFYVWNPISAAWKGVVLA
jgi:hypothetical protein